MNTTEIKSLLFLLDDTDQEVVSIVENKLLSYGVDALPIIQNELTNIQDEYVKEITTDLIHRINYKQLLIEFENWLKSEERDLLEGVYLIAKFKYPNILKREIRESIEKIKLNAWLDMRHDITAFEKVKILNYAFYNIHGFTGNVDNYQSSSNSFINEVLESKKGNPIMLCIIYMLVAQHLKLPVFGINLPQHFMLAYLEEEKVDLSTLDLNKPFQLKADNKNVQFYINAFHKGGVFTKTSLEQFVKQMNIQSNPIYYLPCDNLSIIKRVLRNLASSYKHENEKLKKNQIYDILYLLGEPPLDHFTDVTDSNFED
ncbi:MAG: transglutaminase-like domain-containing protein [Bacteroidota bacterium]